MLGFSTGDWKSLGKAVPRKYEDAFLRMETACPQHEARERRPIPGRWMTKPKGTRIKKENHAPGALPGPR